MFGGIGGALKSLTGKAEEMMEKTKKSVEELAAEKKAAAQAMLEGQVKKTGETFMGAKGEAEKAAMEGKQSAIDGFDQEVSNLEKTVDSSIAEKREEKTESAQKLAAIGGTGDDNQIEKAIKGAVEQVGAVADTKIKEADQFLDEKREEVVQQVQAEGTKATENTSQGVSAILGKAKGFLNF